MAETKIIPSRTSFSVDASSISILTEYDGNFAQPPFIKRVFVSTSAATYWNGFSFVEGEIVMLAERYPNTVNAYINDSGELIVIGQYAGRYSVAEGDLIFT